MDAILNFLQAGFWVILVIVAVLSSLIYIKMRYKIPKANQALVVTGAGKEMKVLPGRGAFITPRRSHEFFPLGTMTVRSDNQETQSITLVPVVVQWTAQIRADANTNGALVKAVRGFSGYSIDDIKESLKQTLDGEVRAVVAKMTPEEVVRDKDGFSTQVKSGVSERMTELGFELVSLNIAEVTDNNRYYFNASAEDREGQRKRAENLRADADKEIAVEYARADELSKSAQQKRDIAVAEQERELQLRKSAIQVETDQAQADAEVAGQLRREERNKELAARRGEVQVIEEQQRNATAQARREVELTDAETARQRAVIEAEAAKQEDEINAEADAREAEISADATAKVAKLRAQGEADAAVARAQGEADALNRRADAEADKTRKTGLAEAEVVTAKGKAEADSIRARGEAEAEAQRRMAEALAANDEANLRVTLAEIDRDTTIKVYTTVGEAMARIGEHASFIDMGGSGSSSESDLLTRVLGNIPEMFKMLDVKSQALHGASFGSTLGNVLGKGKVSQEVAPMTTDEAKQAPTDAELPEVVTSDPTVDDVDDQE